MTTLEATAALAEALHRAEWPNDGPGYDVRDDPICSAKAAALLTLPLADRIAIATELLDVDLPESMTPGEIHVYGGEQGGIGIIGWSSVGIPMGGTFMEHVFLWAIGKLLAALKGA